MTDFVNAPAAELRGAYRAVIEALTLHQARTEARRAELRLEAAYACGNETRNSPLIPAPTYSQALYDYALGVGVRMATAPESVRASTERSFRQYADKFSSIFPAPIWY